MENEGLDSEYILKALRLKFGSAVRIETDSSTTYGIIGMRDGTERIVEVPSDWNVANKHLAIAKGMTDACIDFATNRA